MTHLGQVYTELLACRVTSCHVSAVRISFQSAQTRYLSDCLAFCSYVQVFFVPDLGFSEGGQTGGGRTRPERQSFRLERQRDGMGFGRGGQRALYPLHSPKILYDNLSFLVSTAGKIKLKAVNKNTATVCNSKFNCTLFLSLSMKCNCATSYE